VQNHLAFVEAIDGAVILVGHSIGCHICLEAKTSMPNKVIAVVGLQPFLWPNAESSEQRRIAGMVGIGPLCVLVAALGSLVSLLPARIMDWVRTNIFLGAWNQSLHAADITGRYCFRYQLLRNVFHMGLTEFKDLASPACAARSRAATLAPYQAQLAMLFNEDDHWAPLSAKAELEEVLPGMATFVEERPGEKPWPHDFVTTAPASAHFARRTAEVLAQLLGDALPTCTSGGSTTAAAPSARETT